MNLPTLGGEQPLEWLNSAPAIQDCLFDEIDRFRKTFVQVPGCEQSTAERLREIIGDVVRKLIKHHRLTQASQQRQLDYQVGRHVYAVLHSFLFPHLQRMLASHEERLQKGIASYASVSELVDAIPGAQGRGLGLIDLCDCSEQLEELAHKITPHDKIASIDEAHSVLQRCVAEAARVSGSTGFEITGDDVLSLFILAIYRSHQMRHWLAHVTHVEMYLQGAASRSGSTEAARFEEVGYAVSAMQAALQFFLEEQRRPPTTPAGGPSSAQQAAVATTGGSQSSTRVFAKYLQP